MDTDGTLVIGGADEPGKPGIATVRGSLDKEVIRQVIRTHIPAVRDCYEAILIKRPYPRGRVMTRFLINAEGKVVQACLVHSSLDSVGCERCILEEELRWQFPKPEGGGLVSVDYPFVLDPAEN